MISRNFVPQSLKISASGLFLLLCCLNGAFAQSPSQARAPKQEEGRIADFNFDGVSVRAAIASLGEQLGLEVVFDETVKEYEPLYVAGKNVTVLQALKIVLAAKSLQARIIEKNKIVGFRDNEANCQKYSQYQPWPAKPCPD